MKVFISLEIYEREPNVIFFLWNLFSGGSQTLAISCHATITTPKELTTSTLPATIPAAPMKTTYSTDAMTTMLMTKTTYSAVKASPTIGVLPHITSTKSASTLKDSDVLTSTTAVLTNRQTENSSSKGFCLIPLYRIPSFVTRSCMHVYLLVVYINVWEKRGLLHAYTDT